MTRTTLKAPSVTAARAQEAIAVLTEERRKALRTNPALARVLKRRLNAQVSLLKRAMNQMRDGQDSTSQADSSTTSRRPADFRIGTCPVCHDRRVAFEDAGTVRARQMVECGACGAVVPLAEVDQDGHLPPVSGGDGPIDERERRRQRWATWSGRTRQTCPVCGDDLAFCPHHERYYDLPTVSGGDGPIDQSRVPSFVELVRSAQAGLHEVHDALAELGNPPAHIAEDIRRELTELDDKVTDLAEFIADVARGNRPEDLRALDEEAAAEALLRIYGEQEDAADDDPIAKAAELGKDHGANAASWVFDGITDETTYQHILMGIEEGDPQVLDTLPAPDLSGQWADGFSAKDLLEAVGITDDDFEDPHGDLAQEICEAYGDAFGAEVLVVVERMARRHLGGEDPDGRVWP